MSATVYTLPEIAKLVGAEYRTLKTWESRGLITASIRSTERPGRPGFYSERDARIAGTLVRLRESGLSLDALEAVAAAVRAFDTATCPICEGDIVLSPSQGTGGSDAS